MGNLEGAAPGVPRSWLWLQTLLERSENASMAFCGEL